MASFTHTPKPIRNVERLWSVGEEIRKRQREAEANRAPLPPQRSIHPRHCTACGGTADKPFERLLFYRTPTGFGWSCNGKPLRPES